jgi:hypothetical protein
VELDTVGISVFHDCFFDPYLPESVQERVRSCNSISVVREETPNIRELNKQSLMKSIVGFKDRF